MHKLDDFVKACGNKDKAFDKLEDAFANAVKDRSDGRIEIIIRANGFDITVRGAIVSGAPKIGTAFIP